jgi:prepilin-type N-terminal cleavage/methylation domain-containing protein/prepilin-type processing-associated H-X9-DG protein
MNKQGFTLIELLVVVAIIGIIAAILLPALQKTKEKATTTLCSNNEHQLTMAWIQYADDNSGQLPGFCIGYSALGGGLQNMQDPCPSNVEKTCWVTAVTGATPWEDGIKSGTLWPYTGQDLKIYYCPASKSYDPGIALSYSGLTEMNGFFPPNTSWGCMKMLPYKNMSQVREPSKRIVFTEEGTESAAGGGISGCDWTIRPPCYGSFADVITVQHEGGVNVVWADGHTATYIWKMTDTDNPGGTPELTRQDLNWWQRNTWGIGLLDYACAGGNDCP